MRSFSEPSTSTTRSVQCAQMGEFSERFFRSGTLRIHCRDWHGAGRRPLVIVHGLRDHSHSFDELARSLRDDFHVHVLDLRGHGDSETTPYYAFGHFVLDLHNCVRALRLERPVLVGHSMGGEVVAHFAGSFPDVPDRVVMIEGLGPPPLDMDAEVDWTVNCFARIDRARSGPPGLVDLGAAKKRLRERNPRLSDAQAEKLALLGTRAREDGLLEWKLDPMLCTIGVAGTFNLEYAKAFWRRITAPTLIVNGSESGEFWQSRAGATYLEPDDLAARLAAFQNATYVEIADAGHMVHFDRPDALARVVREYLAPAPATAAR